MEQQEDHIFSCPGAELQSEVLVSKAKGSMVNGGGGKTAECNSAGEESRVPQCLGISISKERLVVNNAAPSTLGFCRLSY